MSDMMLETFGFRCSKCKGIFSVMTPTTSSKLIIGIIECPICVEMTAVMIDPSAICRECGIIHDTNPFGINKYQYNNSNEIVVAEQCHSDCEKSDEK